MLRRSFLKWTSAAAITVLVTTQGFRPSAAGEVARPELAPVQQEQTISPVLQALNNWNEVRWKEHGGVLHEDGSRLIWNPDRMEFNKIKGPVTAEVLREMRPETYGVTSKSLYADSLRSHPRAARGGTTRRNLVETFFGTFKRNG